MKIERKKGIEKPRLVHNKKLFWIIIGLGILLIVLIILIVIDSKNNNSPNSNNNSSNKECFQDSDCVASGCCHPDSCTSIDKKPGCDDMVCTEECSGPLDCGAGSCGCISNRCQVVSKR
jgi:hypothetical protein